MKKSQISKTISDIEDFVLEAEMVFGFKSIPEGEDNTETWENLDKERRGSFFDWAKKSFRDTKVVCDWLIDNHDPLLLNIMLEIRDRTCNISLWIYENAPRCEDGEFKDMILWETGISISGMCCSIADAKRYGGYEADKQKSGDICNYMGKSNSYDVIDKHKLGGAGKKANNDEKFEIYKDELIWLLETMVQDGKLFKESGKYDWGDYKTHEVRCAIEMWKERKGIQDKGQKRIKDLFLKPNSLFRKVKEPRYERTKVMNKKREIEIKGKVGNYLDGLGIKSKEKRVQ